MSQSVPSIPRPLVRVNQWTIVISVVVFWLTGQVGWLFIPLVSGLGGLLFNFHPVMRIAKLFLRKPMNQYIPEEKAQQQFNQVIAVACLAGAVISYAAGSTVLTLAFTIMVAIAAFVAILGFCVGCFIRFQWQQWRYRRHRQAS